MVSYLSHLFYKAFLTNLINDCFEIYQLFIYFLFQKYICNKPYSEEPEYKYDVSNIQYLHPYVNLFSKATFSWMMNLLKLGYQRPLELPDLEELPEVPTILLMFVLKIFHKYFFYVRISCVV